MNQLILIGASNVTIGFPRLVAGLAEKPGQPLEIWGVHGHGRSYGTWSTDIGNDILYGQETTRILEWVETCIERLQRWDTRIVMTRLPLASLEKLSHIRFTVARKILFPGCSFSLAEIRQQAHEVDSRIVALANKHSIPLTEPQGHWYGLDPIHIRSRCLDSAWRQILGGWFPGEFSPSFPRAGLRRALQVWRWWPAERGRRGQVTETPQPVFQHDDLSVRLY